MKICVRDAALVTLIALVATLTSSCHTTPTVNMARLDQALLDAPALPEGGASPKELQKAIKEKGYKWLDGDDISPFIDQCEVTDNIEYGQAGEYTLVLNLWQPKERLANPVPAIIYIHGGGWELKGHAFCSYWCARYAAKGYVCATIEYRTSNEAFFPAAVEDAKCAVRWIRANAEKYNVDPNAIAVVGQSAGAHLALMVGYTDDGTFDGNGGHPEYSSRVQAVVDNYGPSDLAAENVRNISVVPEFLEGKSYEEAPDLYVAASPVTYITPDDPPTLIFHGTVDGIVPVAQSDELAAKLKANGVPCLYDRQEGWDHLMDVFRGVAARCMYIQDAFFEEVIPLPSE